MQNALQDWSEKVQMHHVKVDGWAFRDGVQQFRVKSTPSRYHFCTTMPAWVPAFCITVVAVYSLSQSETAPLVTILEKSCQISSTQNLRILYCAQERGAIETQRVLNVHQAVQTDEEGQDSSSFGNRGATDGLQIAEGHKHHGNTATQVRILRSRSFGSFCWIVGLEQSGAVKQLYYCTSQNVLSLQSLIIF